MQFYSNLNLVVEKAPLIDGRARTPLIRGKREEGFIEKLFWTLGEKDIYHSHYRAVLENFRTGNVCRVKLQNSTDNITAAAPTREEDKRERERVLLIPEQSLRGVERSKCWQQSTLIEHDD